MKILGSIWFDIVGIVKVEFDNGDVVHFIGTGFGIDQKIDEIKIANWGHRFDPDTIFDELD